MAINYDVWGAPETWVDQSGYYSIASIKKPETSRNTFYKLYNSGVLPFNTTDKSVAFWGIGKGSILANPQYISPYTIGGDIDEPAGVDVRPVKAEKTDTPCAFICSKTQKAFPRYISRYAPTRADAPNFNNYNSTIATSFDYSKIVIIPFVYYVQDNYKNGSSTYWRWTVDQYFSTQSEYEARPRVIGFGYRVYVGEAGSRNDLGCGIIPYTWTDVKGYDVSYNNVYFYGQNGYSESNQIGTTENSDTYTFFRFDRDQNVSRNATVGTADTGFRFKYCKSESTEMTWYYFDTDSELWSIQCNAQSGSTKYWNPYPYIAVNSENAATVKEYIYKQIAFLGLPFIKATSASDYNVALGQERFCLPKFDTNGITTGEYEEGADALTLPNAEWIDARTGSGYDPYRPIPAGDLDNVTGRNLNFWSSNKYYLMRQEDLDEFLARVNGLYTGGETAEEKAEELRRMQVDFKGSNPSDYIVGLYGLPFQWVWPKQFFQPVMLGPVEVLPNDSGSSTAVELVNPDSDAEMLFGEIQIPELGNFLDYEPYTTLMLYVPFCGTCKLDAAEYIGHTVRVVGTLDKHTGELAVRIMRDGLTVTNTMTGNLYVRVPVTAQAMGTYETNLHQLQMAAFNREFGLLTNAVTGGVSMGAAAAAGGEGEGGGSGGMISPTAPISMAASLIQLPIAMADYEFRITHCQPPVFYSSSASSANQAKFYRKAKLFIKRPVFLDTYNTDIGKYVYGHTIGYACCKQVEHISDMSSAEHNHYIKCSNVDLTGIPATADELAAIKKALTQGIYI